MSLVGSVLVVGGGIGGIQAALDLAESGYYVYLLEKSPSIGGVMAQLDKTFPTNDCSMCILSPKLVEAASHPQIALLTYSEVEDIQGEPGNFRAKICRKAPYVDWSKCTGCNVCSEWCPVVMPNEFDEGQTNRRAIYTPFPQAVPRKYVVDKKQARLCHAACGDRCPLHQNVCGYLKAAAEGRIDESYKIIRATNPMPACVGRVCYAPCQEACNRGQLDESLAIRDIKRFVADNADVSKLPITRSDPTGKKVAIIGAGPAGLTAAHDLALKGHSPTVFEALPQAGGMLQVGIPEYRLPKAVVQKEVSQIAALGVEIKTGVAVGKDISLKDIKARFDAVFIAIGAHQGMSLRAPGEDLKGVVQGVDFLRRVNLLEKVAVPDDVAVIGGGNTAIDCARTAKRLGAKNVTIFYRRTRDEMPAAKEEIEAAEHEGVKVELLVAPVAFHGQGSLAEMELVRMKLGEPDASGRPRPVPTKGSEFRVRVAMAIAATGQAPALEFTKELGIALSKHGTIEADPVTMATNVAGVYAGGDAVTGPAFVVDAMAAGREAATSIDAYLRGIARPTEAKRVPQKFTAEEVATVSLKVRPGQKAPMPEIPLPTRASFTEVATGYSLDQTKAESARCLAGMGEGCIGCFECVRVCQAGALNHDMVDKVEDIDVGAVVLAGGYRCHNPSAAYELGYGRLPNVVTSLEFERILSASGPYAGVLKRPSDLTPPKKMAFLQCIGSRDSQNPYCSSVCCTYAIKEAIIAKEHSTVPLEVTVFLMDLRTFGKDFDRFYERARDQSGVRFVRARVSDVQNVDGTGDLSLTYTDESGKTTRDKFDLAVLSVGFEAPPEMSALARKLGLQLNPYGFCHTRNFAPVETSRPGIYVAGAFSAPKDIPETVMQASAAAGTAGTLLASARNTLLKKKEYPPEKDVAGEEPRVGVFVCHCGINIAGYVNVPEVTKYARTLPGVAYAENNLYTCSQDTQDKMKQIIQEQRLNRVVVASCTPRTHEPLFQATIREGGLNKYLFEMANIRDQCSWVHMHQPVEATAKAKDLVRMAVAKARLIKPLKQLSMGIDHGALVIGGGVAGMVAALTLADQGFKVNLVEKEKELGGSARRLHYTLEGGDVQAYLADLVQKVTGNSSITVHTGASITGSTGYVGNFVTKLKKDSEAEVEIKHGATIIATGGLENKPHQYLYGRDPRVMTSLELEEAIVQGNPKLAATNSLVMVQCVGSRNEERPYCSRVCCSQAIKNAIRLKELRPDMNVYILYRDIRTYAFKELMYEEARRQGVVFIRYDLDNIPEVKADGKDLKVSVFDPILGQPVSINADILALSVGIVPQNGAKELAQFYKVPLNQDQFFMEAHVKLRPVDFATEGVFLCGLAHSPKFIDESIGQARAAASRAATILSKEGIQAGGAISQVNASKCGGCGLCVKVCPFGAMDIDPKRNVAVSNEALCRGCGVCASSCRSGAIDIDGFSDEQILAMIKAL